MNSGRCWLEDKLIEILKQDQKEMSRSKFAVTIGTSEANIRRWEKDSHMLLSTFCSIIDGLSAARADQVLPKDLTSEEYNVRKQQETKNYKDLYVARLTSDISGLQEMKERLDDAKKEISILKSKLKECRKDCKK